MPQYYNHNTHTVFLTGPNGGQVKIGPKQKIVLPDYFDRYCDRFIRRAQDAGTPAVTQASRVPRVVRPSRVQPIKPATIPRPAQPVPVHKRPVAARRIVGRTIPGDSTKVLSALLHATRYPISNGVGVGILSYNRPRSLRRLVESIRRYTDLCRTTVFISDDGSTDTELLAYLGELSRSGDFVVLTNRDRLGVAGNSNRLLRCLRRFEHGILLNDDVEVVASGWDTVYVVAAKAAGLRHFCMRQSGVYGAKLGTAIQRNGVDLRVVADKPHGAILYYDTSVVDSVGYFDERFGIYGVEHVDWSTRLQALQGPGFYDVAGSERFFIIHSDPSAAADRVTKLQEARAIAGRLPPRSHVAPSDRSAVPAISYVVPCRNISRSGALGVVIDGIRAQRYPHLEIIIAEHDHVSRLPPLPACIIPCLAAAEPADAFNKAMAFNLGVARATCDNVVLHDADMLLPATYTQRVAEVLANHDACHLGKTVIYTTKLGSDSIIRDRVVGTGVPCDRTVGYYEGGSLACRRRTYWAVGGFCEDFKGYGVEDCEFYARLAANCNWLEDRTLDLVHLWHSRLDGWMAQHERNKELGRRLAARPMADRIRNQIDKLTAAGYGGQFGVT